MLVDGVDPLLSLCVSSLQCLFVRFEVRVKLNNALIMDKLENTTSHDLVANLPVPSLGTPVPAF